MGKVFDEKTENGKNFITLEGYMKDGYWDGK